MRADTAHEIIALRAVADTAIEWRCWYPVVAHPGAQKAALALVAAVDRLAAPGPKEAT